MPGLTLQDINRRFDLYAGTYLKVRSWDLTVKPLVLNPAQQVIYARMMAQQARGLPIRIIILKGRQMGISTFCMPPQTKVLLKSLRWACLGDLGPGDELVGVEEDNGTKDRRRKFAPTKVVGTSHRRAEVFEIMTDRGKIAATAEHPFLAKIQRDQHSMAWMRMDELRPGRQIAKWFDVWLEESGDTWLAGMADAEGSLSRQKSGGVNFVISQNEGGIAARIAAEMQRRGFSPAVRREREGRLVRVGLSAVREVMRFLGQVRPQRFLERGAWWEEGVGLAGKTSDARWVRVESVRSLGIQEVVSIETTSRTFIAEGFVTHNCQGYSFWRAMNPLTSCMTIAHDLESTTRIFDMAKFFHDNQPADLKPMKRYSNRKELVFENPDEKARVSNPGLRSRIEIRTAGNIGSGKGLTLNVLHVSEIAVYRQPEMIASSLFPAVPPTAESAILIESTAHIMGYWFREQWTLAKDGQSGFIPIFLPWYLEPRYCLRGSVREEYLSRGPLDDYEKEMMAQFNLEPGHLAFRRMKMEELQSEDLFRQEYPLTDEEAWITVGHPLLPAEVLRRMEAAAIPGTTGEYIGKQIGFIPNREGHLTLWEPPQEGQNYVIGADTSQGAGDSDPSCVQVLTSGKQQRQAASWHGRIDPIALAAVIEALARWYNDAMVCIEINGTGLMAQTALKERGYVNFYRWRYLDKVGTGISERIGWYTSSSNKPALVGSLRHHLLSGLLAIRDPETVNELKTFVTDQRGGAQAAPGMHDDRIMALAIASMCDTLAGGTSGWAHQTPEYEQQQEMKDARFHDLLPGPWSSPERDWRTM